MPASKMTGGGLICGMRFTAGRTWAARARLAWLHGRVCVPHPACPESFDYCRWITYADAVAITGRSAHTFARWRWDHRTVPDESAWRLLEWTVHGCCAWPARAPSGPDLLT